MSTNAFDAIFHQAAAEISRRASLRILGGAPLAAALMGSSIVEARKSDKKGTKKPKKQPTQCLAQVGQCHAYVTGACGSSLDPGACETRNGQCCEFLGSCDAAEFFSCLAKANQTP